MSASTLRSPTPSYEELTSLYMLLRQRLRAGDHLFAGALEPPLSAELPLAPRSNGLSAAETGSSSAASVSMSPPRLSWAEFQLAFGSGANAPAVKRIFDVLDREGLGSLSADDFASGLAPLFSADEMAHPDEATRPETLRFLFDVFDLNGDGAIGEGELLVLLHSAARQLGGACLPTELLESVVSRTLKEMDGEGRGEISWDAFSRHFGPRPAAVRQLVDSVGLDVNRTTARLLLSLDGRWLEQLVDEGEESRDSGWRAGLRNLRNLATAGGLATTDSSGTSGSMMTKLTPDAKRRNKASVRTVLAHVTPPASPYRKNGDSPYMSVGMGRGHRRTTSTPNFSIGRCGQPEQVQNSRHVRESE